MEGPSRQEGGPALASGCPMSRSVPCPLHGGSICKGNATLVKIKKRNINVPILKTWLTACGLYISNCFYCDIWQKQLTNINWSVSNVWWQAVISLKLKMGNAVLIRWETNQPIYKVYISLAWENVWHRELEELRPILTNLVLLSATALFNIFDEVYNAVNMCLNDWVNVSESTHLYEKRFVNHVRSLLWLCMAGVIYD